MSFQAYKEVADMNKLVTAVLLTYKRDKELKQIIESLKQFEFITEILICDNNVNRIIYGRYETALKAANEDIYVQDDDCIVNNIRQMHKLYDGTLFINSIKANRMSDYNGQESLVGWGAFFNKNWITVLNKYIEIYGEDSLLLREADRIFTYLLEVPRLTVAANVTDFPCANDKSSLGYQKEHQESRQEALRRCKIISGSIKMMRKPSIYECPHCKRTQEGLAGQRMGCLRCNQPMVEIKKGVVIKSEEKVDAGRGTKKTD